MATIEYRPFEETFRRIIAGEKLDVYQVGLSQALERIALWLFRDLRPKHWYDGVSELGARKRKALQVEFDGEMWVGDSGWNQWLEPFRARAPDKTCTNQGLWIEMHIGEYDAEADLFDGYLKQ